MHVWTQAEFLQLILACRERFGDAFDVEAAARSGDRVHRRPPQAGPASRPSPPPTPGSPAAAAAPGALERLRHVSKRVLAQGPRRGSPPEGDDHRSPATLGARQRPSRSKRGAWRRPSASRPTGSTRSKSGSSAPSPRATYRELRALDGVSFEIHQGEFFGIVGRNGSGKSTLLKLLASIYRADAGTIRMAGRLAPFIELGVGFNPELTARENVVLNGVMMGLTPKETREPPRRRDRVRRTRGIRRPETEELLLGDAGPARLLGDAAGRRRRAADRRGAGGRRRRLPAEVRRRLPRDESGGQDDRPGHPRDVDGRGVLPPGDADRRREDPATSATRPRSAAATCGSTSNGAAKTGGDRRLAKATRCGCSTPGSRTPTASA